VSLSTDADECNRDTWLHVISGCLTPTMILDCPSVAKNQTYTMCLGLCLVHNKYGRLLLSELTQRDVANSN